MTELEASSIVGPFEIVQALHQGQGGMSRTYVARQRGKRVTNLVCLKIAMTVSDQDRQRLNDRCLSNEVEWLRKLSHPSHLGVVKILPIPWGVPKDPYLARVEEIEGQPWFFSMEYLEGGSLEARMRERRYFEVGEAVEIACQVGRALIYIHGHGLAHLDVKPENILFRERVTKGALPEAVLIDFGIARRVQMRSLSVGTLPYVAPERILLAKGEIPAEQVEQQYPADVYSLGMLLYWMLTGQTPLKTTTDIMKKEPKPPSGYRADIPPAIVSIVMQAIEKDPRLRPGLPEMVERLDRTVPAPRLFPEQQDRPIKSGTWRKRVVVALGGILLLAALAGGSYMIVSQPPVTPTVTPSPTRIAPTATPTSTQMPTPTRTITPSPTPQWSTPVPTFTPTNTPTRTPTYTPTSTPAPGVTGTPVTP